MAGDTNDYDTLWRWLSHSEETIFMQDGLYNLKDLLHPSAEELPPCEMLETSKNLKGDDKDVLEKQLKGKVHFS